VLGGGVAGPVDERLLRQPAVGDGRDAWYPVAAVGVHVPVVLAAVDPSDAHVLLSPSLQMCPPAIPVHRSAAAAAAHWSATGQPWQYSQMASMPAVWPSQSRASSSACAAANGSGSAAHGTSRSVG